MNFVDFGEKSGRRLACVGDSLIKYVIGIIYCIFIRRLITTIIFINLLLLGKLTIKLIKISYYLYIRIGNG
jgi:hypothetical protein